MLIFEHLKAGDGVVEGGEDRVEEAKELLRKGGLQLGLAMDVGGDEGQQCHCHAICLQQLRNREERQVSRPKSGFIKMLRNQMLPSFFPPLRRADAAGGGIGHGRESQLP